RPHRSRLTPPAVTRSCVHNPTLYAHITRYPCITQAATHPRFSLLQEAYWAERGAFTPARTMAGTPIEPPNPHKETPRQCPPPTPNRSSRNSGTTEQVPALTLRWSNLDGEPPSLA